MNDPLKSRVVFDDAEISFNQEIINEKKTFDLAELEHFSPASSDIDAEQNNGEIEGLIQQALKPKSSIWRKIVITGIGLFSVSVIAQATHWVWNAWLQQDWISLGAGVASALIILAGVGAIASEWRRLYRLRERSEERETAKELLLSHNLDKGKAFCEKLIKQAGFTSDHPAVQRWQASVHETHNDREVVTLYSKLVQPALDQRAKKEVSRFAAESALMIAVSPLAVVDMAFIAWRNVKLINRIAAIYGIELGYFSRLRLFRLVLINVAFAGATELVSEVGMDWMSQDFIAKLSTRAAQGIGAGILTARLGIKAMELCRPLPWIENDKPKLGEFRLEVVNQLKHILPKSKKEKSK